MTLPYHQGNCPGSADIGYQLVKKVPYAHLSDKLQENETRQRVYIVNVNKKKNTFCVLIKNNAYCFFFQKVWNTNVQLAREVIVLLHYRYYEIWAVKYEALRLYGFTLAPEFI